MRRLYDMKYNVEHADWLNQEIKDMRKDSHVKLSRDDIRDWLYTINGINRLKATVTIFNNEELKLFLVPNKVKNVIVPGKITVSKGNFERNFKGKVYDEENTINTYNKLIAVSTDDEGNKVERRVAQDYTPRYLDSDEFNKVSRKLLRSFKLNDNESDLSNAYSLREENLLSNYQEVAIKDGNVKKVATTFIPVYVDFFKYEDDEYTFCINKMFKKYFEDNLFYASNSNNQI